MQIGRARRHINIHQEEEDDNQLCPWGGKPSEIQLPFPLRQQQSQNSETLELSALVWVSCLVSLPFPSPWE